MLQKNRLAIGSGWICWWAHSAPLDPIAGSNALKQGRGGREGRQSGNDRNEGRDKQDKTLQQLYTLSDNHNLYISQLSEYFSHVKRVSSNKFLFEKILCNFVFV